MAVSEYAGDVPIVSSLERGPSPCVAVPTAPANYVTTVGYGMPKPAKSLNGEDVYTRFLRNRSSCTY
jgi:hypothetical protein